MSNTAKFSMTITIGVCTTIEAENIKEAREKIYDMGARGLFATLPEDAYTFVDYLDVNAVDENGCEQ